jgi:hypothetical protein
MKWMLVVLIGRTTPVNTNLVVRQVQRVYGRRRANAPALCRRIRCVGSLWASSERRRDYRRARDMQAKRLLGNVGTCVPHADDNRPQIVTPQPPAAPSTLQPTPNLVRAHDAASTIWSAASRPLQAAMAFTVATLLLGAISIPLLTM